MGSNQYASNQRNQVDSNSFACCGKFVREISKGSGAATDNHHQSSVAPPVHTCSRKQGSPTCPACGTLFTAAHLMSTCVNKFDGSVALSFVAGVEADLRVLPTVRGGEGGAGGTGAQSSSQGGRRVEQTARGVRTRYGQ